MSEINAEFGLGNNLNAYRGVTWWTDAGGTGTFDSTNIDFAEFYGKRPTAPGPVLVFNNSNNFDSFSAFSEAGFRFNTNGSITQLGQSGNYPSAYLNPTGTNYGANYEARAYVTAAYGGVTLFGQIPPAMNAYTPWVSLGTIRYADASAGFSGYMTGTIYIRKIGTTTEISRSFTIEAAY